MKTNWFYGVLILLTCLPWQPAAQTVIINGVPRDTSYTVYSSFQKEVKRFPFIRIETAELPAEAASITKEAVLDSDFFELFTP